MKFRTLVIHKLTIRKQLTFKYLNIAKLWDTPFCRRSDDTFPWPTSQVFYVEGGFPTQSVYERYNNRVNIFKANYRSAVLYSKAVDPIFQEGVTATGTNLTAVIERFRFEIQHTMNTDASITKGELTSMVWVLNVQTYCRKLKYCVYRSVSLKVVRKMWICVFWEFAIFKCTGLIFKKKKENRINFN